MIPIEYMVDRLQMHIKRRSRTHVRRGFDSNVILTQFCVRQNNIAKNVRVYKECLNIDQFICS